jgi:spore coat protein A, manganese oxidase
MFRQKGTFSSVVGLVFSLLLLFSIMPATAQEAGILDPLTIPKFVEPLVIPPVMEPVTLSEDRAGFTEYEIAVRQFQQQVLPAAFPMTTVWGYGKAGDPLPGEGSPSSFNYPAFTVETYSDSPVRVTWVNQLVDDPKSADSLFLPHLFAVDQTLHWANPGAPMEMEQTENIPYHGPIPIVTHVHGAHVDARSDGYPEAWYLPAASNIPDGYRTEGTLYNSASLASPGAAVFEYSNDQRAATLWYHDHALGITRQNVYAGMAGFWLIRDDIEDSLNLPGPAPRLGDDPGTRYYEIPLAIQDRTFKEDGSLFYPDSRDYFDNYTGPFIPETTVSPIWNPEFFGNTMLVNGRTWPYLEVEPRLYRFRMLNGSNSRFLILKFNADLTFHQIGTEGGLLPGAPVVLDQLLLAPAERADVIVDFSQFQPGDEIILLNGGPDDPFGGLPLEPGAEANPETTGQVMQFRVVELTDNGNPGEVPTSLPAIDRLESTVPDRTVTLNEEMYMPADVPVEALLGSNSSLHVDWGDEITERMTEGDVEIWNLVNLTEDAHPIHLHLVSFQVVERIPVDVDAFREAVNAVNGEGIAAPDPLDYVTEAPVDPESWETGWKDTVIAYPGVVTRIIARFDRAGLYVWHCHILEHEDNEMMRPYLVESR